MSSLLPLFRFQGLLFYEPFINFSSSRKDCQRLFRRIQKKTYCTAFQINITMFTLILLIFRSNFVLSFYQTWVEHFELVMDSPTTKLSQITTKTKLTCLFVTIIYWLVETEWKHCRKHSPIYPGFLLNLRPSEQTILWLKHLENKRQKRNPPEYCQFYNISRCVRQLTPWKQRNKHTPVARKASNWAL